jgi:hypothetical protein
MAADKEEADAYLEANKKRYEAMVKIEELEAANAEKAIKRNEQVAKSAANALVEAANAHENFLKVLKKQLLRWAEELAAEKAVMFLLSAINPVGIAGGIAGSTSELSLAQLAGQTSSRMGGRALGPAF